MKQQEQNGIPRRNRMDLFSPAELAIYNVVGEVEKVGADVRLTYAIIKLNEARSLVADYIDDCLENDIPVYYKPSESETGRTDEESSRCQETDEYFMVIPLEKPYSSNQEALMDILKSEAVSSSKRIIPHIKLSQFEVVVTKIEKALPRLKNDVNVELLEAAKFFMDRFSCQSQADSEGCNKYELVITNAEKQMKL